MSLISDRTCFIISKNKDFAVERNNELYTEQTTFDNLRKRIFKNDVVFSNKSMLVNVLFASIVFFFGLIGMASIVEQLVSNPQASTFDRNKLPLFMIIIVFVYSIFIVYNVFKEIRLELFKRKTVAKKLYDLMEHGILILGIVRRLKRNADGTIIIYEFVSPTGNKHISSYPITEKLAFNKNDEIIVLYLDDDLHIVL